MMKTTKKWSEDRIVRAFTAFISLSVEDDPERVEKRLRGYFKEIGEGPFGADDILLVVEKFVSSQSTNQLTKAVLDRLNVSS